MKLTLFSTVSLLTLVNLAVPALAENPEHTRQLLSTKQCPQCQLNSAGLVMTDLSGANLAGADLTRANLSRANMAGADLRGAKLIGASLYGANLVGADLTGADLTAVDLREAYLYNAKMTGADLSTAYMEKAIGVPEQVGTAEDFSRWAALEGEKGNYELALQRYDRALSMKPRLAGAYLGRALVKYRLGDEPGSNRDARIARKLFQEQKNKTGYQASQDFLEAVELAKQPQKEEKSGSNFGNVLGGIASLLLQFLL
jgi:tetratricopeptide (TPR) repeat protein